MSADSPPGVALRWGFPYPAVPWGGKDDDAQRPNEKRTGADAAPGALLRRRRSPGRDGETVHRSRHLLHGPRSRPRRDAGPRARGRKRRSRRRRVPLPLRRPGRVRRDRHGAPRDALLPPAAGDRGGPGRVGGRGARARRARPPHQLRQDHARHADGGGAARHPVHRPDGGPDALGPDREPAPVAGLRHLRGGRPLPAGRDRRGGAFPPRGGGVPRRRVVPGALHREHDGVPDRDDGDVPPRVRHGPRGDVEEAAHRLRERAAGGRTRAQGT